MKNEQVTKRIARLIPLTVFVLLMVILIPKTALADGEGFSIDENNISVTIDNTSVSVTGSITEDDVASIRWSTQNGLGVDEIINNSTEATITSGDEGKTFSASIDFPLSESGKTVYFYSLTETVDNSNPDPVIGIKGSKSVTISRTMPSIEASDIYVESNAESYTVSGKVKDTESASKVVLSTDSNKQLLSTLTNNTEPSGEVTKPEEDYVFSITIEDDDFDTYLDDNDNTFALYALSASNQIIAKKEIHVYKTPHFEAVDDTVEVSLWRYNNTRYVDFNIYGYYSGCKIAYSLTDYSNDDSKTDAEIINLLTNEQSVNLSRQGIKLYLDSYSLDGEFIYFYLYNGSKIYDSKMVEVRRSWQYYIDASYCDFILYDSQFVKTQVLYLNVGEDAVNLAFDITNDGDYYSGNSYPYRLQIVDANTSTTIGYYNFYNISEPYGYNKKYNYRSYVQISGLQGIGKQGKKYTAYLQYNTDDGFVGVGKSIDFEIYNQIPEMYWDKNEINDTSNIILPEFDSSLVANISGNVDGDFVAWTTQTFTDEDAKKEWGKTVSQTYQINDHKVVFPVSDFPRENGNIHFYLIRNVDDPDNIDVYTLDDCSIQYKTIKQYWGKYYDPQPDYKEAIYNIKYESETVAKDYYFTEIKLVDGLKVGSATINGHFYEGLPDDKVIWTLDDMDEADFLAWAKDPELVGETATQNEAMFGIKERYNEYKFVVNNLIFDGDNTSYTLHVYVKRDLKNGDYKIIPLGDVIIKEAHDPKLIKVSSKEFGNQNSSDYVISFDAEDYDTGIEEVKLVYYVNNQAQPMTAPNSDGIDKPEKIFSGEFHLNGLTKEMVKTIQLIVTDNDGRTSTYVGLFANKPSLEVAPANKLQTYGKDKYYLSGTRNEVFVITAEKGSESIASGDTDATNLDTIEIFVNGVNYKTYSYSDKKDPNARIELNLSDAKIARAENGLYHVEIIATNNLGNSVKKDFTLDVDSSTPEISKFIANYNEFSTNGNEQRYEIIKNSSLETEIFAIDEGSGGIKDVNYYWKDTSGNKSETVVEKFENHPDHAEVKVNKDQSYKGFLYASVEDMLGNKPEKDVTYGGVIIELPSTHGNDEHIGISVPESGAKDRNGKPLYNSAKTFTVSVTDGFSGIARVEWKVTAPHDSSINKSGSMSIDLNGNMTGELWNKNGTDKNLITSVSKDITVDGNSDDIVLWVKMTDQAGNSSEKSVSFSIDKVNPTISVTYGGAAGDPEFTNYYSDTRTATIVVKERNFNQDSAYNMISNTLGNKGTLSSWKESRDDKNPDNSTYTATVTFDKDDRYNLTYQVSDRAGNSADTVTTPEFIIDKVNPEISIAFDNGNGLNGYYANARSATISVKDVNFEASRVTITGVNGQEYTLSNWTRKDNTYSALITFSKDGVFTFEASVRDKAGNQGNTVRTDKFTIDQTKPEITIDGLKNKSAYKGSITPTISFKDTNIDKNSVKLELIGANRGRVDLTDQYVVSEDGLTYTLKDIEAIKENDDLYTLRVTVKDLAGNTTTEEIKFSINRFGSIYVLGDMLKGVNDKYVRKAKGLKITEINVNKIKKGSVVITLSINGIPKTLVEGTDFTIVAKESDDEWNEYTYEFDDSLFSKDGSYIISIASEDEAGNKNNSDNEEKEASIKFGIDATAPIIAAINFEPYMYYAVNGMDFVISVKDNMLLDSFEVYVNGQKVDCKQDGEMITFYVAESNKRQDIKVIAKDRAGNETIESFESILVAGNILIRFAHNKAAIIITAASFLAILIGIGALIGIRRARV